MKLNSIIATALCLSPASLGLAQEMPTPVDRNYPGIIELHVDATNVAQKIFKVHERIPVKPGPITLLYPRWLLGAHAPVDNSLAQFAGLTLSADRHRIEWKRDPLNMRSFNTTVPAGVSALEADFVFLSPLEGSQGAIVITPEMLAVHWEVLVLSPLVTSQTVSCCGRRLSFRRTGGRARTDRTLKRRSTIQGPSISRN